MTTPAPDTAHAPHGYITDKDRYLNRLKRIEGQARGISKMVDEEKYCIDILTQISALTSALQAVAVGLLDDHLKHCVLDAARMEGDQAEQKIKEASDALFGNGFIVFPFRSFILCLLPRDLFSPPLPLSLFI